MSDVLFLSRYSGPGEEEKGGAREQTQTDGQKGQRADAALRFLSSRNGQGCEYINFSPRCLQLQLKVEFTPRLACKVHDYCQIEASQG